MYTLQDCYKDFHTKKYKEVKLVKKKTYDTVNFLGEKTVETRYYDEDGNTYIEV